MMAMCHALFLCALLLSLVFGHPGHHGTAEMTARNEYMQRLSSQTRESCSHRLATVNRRIHIATRRDAILDSLRQAGSLNARNIVPEGQNPANLNHISPLSIGPHVPDSVVFGESAAVLSPEVSEGPYFVDRELIRSNIGEDQPGVPLFLDLQVLDMNTCDPVSGLAVDLWHSNATGIYSGVVFPGNGEANDQSNLQRTFNRGVQITNQNGVVSFQTIYPGHYSGRTIHLHVLTHVSAQQSGGSVTGGHIAHVGQLYFDQALNDAIRRLPPYNSNSNSWVPNTGDGIFNSGLRNRDDPIVQWTQLSNSLADGVFAYITIGIDPNASRNVQSQQRPGL